MNKILFVLPVLVFVFTASKESFAQHHFSLDGKISLDSLTKYVHKNSGVRFSFNSTKVKGSKEIFFPKGQYSLEQILQQIRKTTSLYYSFYSGYVVFQDNPPKQSKLQATTNNNAKAKEKPLKKKNTTTKNTRTNVKIQEKIKKDISVGEVMREDTGQNQLSAKSDSLKTDTAAANNYPLVTINTIDTTSQKDSAKAIVQGKKPFPATGDTSKKSTINTTKPSSSKNARIRNPVNIHYGIQWNLNLPVYGFGNYFTGTNSKNQFYTFLIPGVWISKSIGTNNNELLLLFKPEQEYFMGKKVVKIFTGPLSPPTDTTSIQRNTFITKIKSIYASLQYNYQLNSNWAIGGGINFHWQYEALVLEQTTRLSNGTVLADSLFGIKKSSSFQQFIKPSLITTRLEVAYKAKKLDIGAAVFIPITSVFVQPVSAVRPINTHLFLRWRIK